MIKAAIIGATGYTGSELVRILINHPEVDLNVITSESYQGKLFSAVHSQFEGLCDLRLSSSAEVGETEIDVCFLALPHRISMEYVQKWTDQPFKIIDLSGDYRLSSAAVYEQWYDKAHITPELVARVPYGLPELNRDAIRNAHIVANPGCYPTASILALAPLLSSGMIATETIIVDAKSGLTGAGIKSNSTTHFSNVNDNFKAYGLKTHRHTIEIEEALSMTGSTPVTVQFTPHLLPVDRGIFVTAYATPKKPVSDEELHQIYTSFYQDEPFIRIRSSVPELKHVRGTNLCDIHATYDKRTKRIIILSAIDNLMKGAAGQAVHNMNILFNLKETSGLLFSPLKP